MKREAKSKLAVYIRKATALRAADFSLTGGKSDPYCTCQVGGRPETQIKTQVVKKSLDPEWNYQGEVDGCKVGDKLEFCVYDHDLVGADDLLGRVTLDWEQFSRGFEGTLALQDTGKKESFLVVKIDRIEVPLDKADIPRCFVLVESADDLRAADWGGKSDPYVIVGVPATANPKPKFRTKVKLSTISPEWMEEDEVPQYELGDDIEFIVYDWDRLSADDELGRVTLQAKEFTPDGFSGSLELNSSGRTQGTLAVRVELYIPVPPKPSDPADHVLPEVRKPAPFLLRCLDTGKEHRLSTYTVVGRSERELDPRYDLLLQSPGIIDVSRRHAIIKCWSGADPASWRARVYCTEEEEIRGRGVGCGPGSGHAGGGTSVDNEPVALWKGTEIVPGSVLRFGIREMWVLERAVLYQKSQVGEAAVHKAHRNAKEDPGTFRELKVPSGACNQALHHCSDWDSFVRVILEWCGEPDEAPCVDVVEVLDECGSRAGRYEANTLEAQEAFNVRTILREVRMGTTIRLRLASDPQLLAPVLRKLETHLKVMADIHDSRQQELFSGPN